MTQLPAPARRALENANILTLKKLSSHTEKEILQLHGMGRASIPLLNDALKKAGLSLKAELKTPFESKELHWLRKQLAEKPDVTEAPHFEKTSFRIRKKIIATYDIKRNRACLKLSPTDQDLYSVSNVAISAVPNKWGQQGWTFVEMALVDKKLIKAMLASAYEEVFKK